MNQRSSGYAENSEKTAYVKDVENIEKKDYLESLVDKMESLGLAEESYVNQLSERLEPILGEAEHAKLENTGFSYTMSLI